MMSGIPRIGLGAWITLAGVSLVVPTVQAQEGVEDDGRVFGVVFRRGTADVVPGATVRIGPAMGTTGSDGAFDLVLPPGEHAIRVVGPDGRERPAGSVAVGPGMTSEVLVSWDPTLSVLPTQVESPAASAVARRTASSEDGPAGTLQGQVRSSDGGGPVAGARLFVRGRADEAVTDAEGRFSLSLPAGSWELSVVAGSYSAQSIPNVVVVAGEETALPIALTPAGVKLDDFIVRAPAITGNTAALLDERRESSAVADVLGAEQMSRAGDSSAASALRRVTGLTLVGGRFIFVRGLGERYSQTLLNGAMLPSPEPERRVIPLDLFPAMILDSVVIQKTFSPDQPAEFGGGVVQLRTRKFPTEPVFRVAVSGGYTTGVTGQEGYTGIITNTDILGIGAGPRALSPVIAEPTEDQALVLGDRFTPDGFSAAELEAFGEAMPNRWSPVRQVLPPDFGVQLSVGGGKRFDDDRAVGALLAFNWSNRWDDDLYDRSFYSLNSDKTLRETNRFTFDEANNNILISGLAAFGVEPAPGHEITSTTVVLRNTDNNARVYQGYYEEDDNDLKVQRIQWIERQLLSQQFRGTHDFATGPRPVNLQWRYAFSRATRKEPDRRSVRYDYNQREERFDLSSRADSNGIFFNDLKDDAHDAALDLTVPIKLAEDRDVKLKVGGLMFVKDRIVDTRRFGFQNRGGIDLNELQNIPEALFSTEAIRPDGFQLVEVTQTTDNYSGSQLIGAGYAMAEIPILPWLDAMAGVRVEHSSQKVETFELFNPNQVPVVSELTTTDVLPAATLNIRPIEEVGIRLGYGRTVSRPEFRELSPAYFSGVVGGRPQFGNPDLGRATIENVDLRVEWFPDRGDVISASGFFKQFANPIEQVVIIGADEALTFQNAKAARNFGVEVEARKNLSFIAESVRDLFVAANASFIFSRIDLGENGGVQTNDVRALQGQSPWVVNAQIGYDNPDLGINAAILYNATGPRIAEVGSFGLPDSYVLPFHQLDIVVGADLPRGFNLRLTARNLLDSAETLRIGDTDIVESRKPGVSFGARLEWNLAGKDRTWGKGKRKAGKDRDGAGQ